MTTSTTLIKILLVDDSSLVRQGVRSVIMAEGQGQMEIVGEADSVQTALAQAKLLQPDVILLDIRLPDGSGLDATPELLRICPQTRVLILTSFTNDELIYNAVIAGAHGYLMKEVDPTGLLKAISDTAAGKSVLTPDVTARMLRMIRNGGQPNASGDLAALSPQENRVLALVAEGMTNKEVGDQLKLSENTVKNYLVSVFDKLKVKRRSQAAAKFVQATHKPN
ncbi:MAG: response regulator transcription factor [Cephaloticoccus sp.]|nr:response regulator transcription factor [Cephaloticoccus sp.]MCF7761260.1 response regulator transcription factor [Cephaloticoccus sp.]